MLLLVASVFEPKCLTLHVLMFAVHKIYTFNSESVVILNIVH